MAAAVLRVNSTPSSPQRQLVTERADWRCWHDG